MALTGRKLVPQLVHEISALIGPASVSGLLGVLPAGCVAGFYHLAISTAFNSTTNTIALGTTPGGAQILAATDLKTPVRIDAQVPAAAAGPFSVDTPIYYTLASTGPAPTTGVAVAYLDFPAALGPMVTLSSPARKTHYQAMHQISQQGGFGQTSGLIGILPPGAVLGCFRMLTSQAFNSTTNTIQLGTTPGGSEVMAASSIQAAGIYSGAIIPPASTVALFNAVPTPTPIYYTLASTGAAPTQGVISVWLEYLAYRG